MYVAGPTIPLETLCHGPGFAASFGDAIEQRGRDLASSPATDPSVFPEERMLTVSNDHAGGGEEDRALLGRELQVQVPPGAPAVGAGKP